MNEREILVRVLKAAVRGEAVGKINKTDGAALYSAAAKQGVGILIFPVFRDMYDQGMLDLSEEKFNAIESNVTNSVMRYTARQFAVYTLLEKMKNEGIEFILLKGDTLAYLYANPDYRLSGDADILIDSDKEAECCEFFKRNGAEVCDRADDNNERVVLHKTAGPIEIHIANNTKTISEIWYDNADAMVEKSRQIQLLSRFTVNCMGYTDTAINMLLHFIKHYIGGIANLKMLADTMLFIDREFENIDKKRFYSVIDKLKYTTIFDCMVCTADKCIGLCNLKPNNSAELIASDFLEDVFACGERKKPEEAGVISFYSERRYSPQKGNYNAYSRRVFLKKLPNVFFPDKVTMRTKYPILRKHKYLLPVFYVWRFIDILLFRKKRRQKLATDEVAQYKDKRIKLIEKMGMI